MTDRPPGMGIKYGFLKLGAGEALARVMAFGATVYLARLLGAGMYGTIVLAMTLTAYAGRISDCGVDLLGLHDVAGSPDSLPALLDRYLGARLVVATLLTVVIVAAGVWILPQPDGMMVAAFAFTLAPIALGTRWAHLGLERAGLVSISRTATELLVAALIVTTVHTTDDALRVPVAQLLGEATGAFILLRVLPRATISIRVRERPAEIARLYRRAWPLVLTSLLGLVILNSDFLFLRLFRDASTLGVYAAAYAMVSFLMNLGNAYQLTLTPSLERAKRNIPHQRAIYQTALARVFAVMLPVSIGGALVAPQLLPAVFGAEYVGAVLPLQILLWAAATSNIRNVPQAALLSHGRQDRLLHYAMMAGVLNVVLNIALIPRFGLLAAASVTVATEAMRTLPMLRFLHGMDLPVARMRRLLKPTVAGMIMVVPVFLTRGSNVWVAIATGVVTYTGVLALLGGIRLGPGRVPELTV